MRKLICMNDEICAVKARENADKHRKDANIFESAGYLVDSIYGRIEGSSKSARYEVDGNVYVPVRTYSSALLEEIAIIAKKKLEELGFVVKDLSHFAQKTPSDE